MLQDQFDSRKFHLTFSGAPRFIEREALLPNFEEKLEADSLRRGWQLDDWSLPQTARVLLLLSLSYEDKDHYLKFIEKLFDTGELHELVALYSSLSLLAYPHAWQARAAEGVRTNMVDVFDAIALRNPYPTDYLEENAWNQMYLKAVFMGRPIYKIHGQDQRANEDLARIASDYAHERWAAGREVTPEIWRPLALFVNETITEDLKKLLSSENPLEQAAGALVCEASNYEAAHRLLGEYPDLKQKVEQKEITWDYIIETLNQS
ncbi:MAG: EboA domain-containing protein [Bacteroidota bacterium]